MANFNNTNVPVPGGCGVNNLPTYGTYQLSAQCPNDGFGASSFATNVQPLQFALNKPTPKLTFGSSAGARSIVFGHEIAAESRCADFLTSVTGISDFTDAFDGATTSNPSADAFFCFIDESEAVISLIVKVASGDISSLSGIQVIGNPCNACYSSDVQFQGIGGCNGQCDFTVSNIIVGDSNFFVLSLPAGAAVTVDICSCIVETPSFSGCPSAPPVIAQVPVGSYCPPVVGGRQF